MNWPSAVVSKEQRIAVVGTFPFPCPTVAPAALIDLAVEAGA